MAELNMMIPLEIGLIDEGRYMKNLNKALCELQKKIIGHVKEHGLKAYKAKASVEAKITFACLDPEQGSYGCLASIKTTVPAIPSAASMLMSGETQTGEGCLLCKASGSSIDHPGQGKLCTKDGRLIDTDTGEVVDD